MDGIGLKRDRHSLPNATSWNPESLGRLKTTPSAPSLCLVIPTGMVPCRTARFYVNHKQHGHVRPVGGFSYKKCITSYTLRHATKLSHPSSSMDKYS